MSKEETGQSALGKILEEQSTPVEGGPPSRSRRGSKPRRRVPSRFDQDILDSYYTRRKDPKKSLDWKSYDVPTDQTVTTRNGVEIPLVTAIDRELRKAAKSLIPDDWAELGIVFQTNPSPTDPDKTRIWFATKLKGEKIN